MAITNSKLFASIFMALLLAVPAFADTSSGSTGVPGSINYVEGQVSMGAKPLDSKSIGSAELRTGEWLTTAKGKAEVLLTPGVFVRGSRSPYVASNSYAHGIYHGYGSAGGAFHSGPRMTGSRGFSTFGGGFHGSGGFHPSGGFHGGRSPGHR